MNVTKCAGISARLIAFSIILPTSGAQAQNTTSYRVDSKSSTTINLDLCATAVDVRVQGDTDTDLDFTIRDSNGAIVHSDVGRTDWTSVTLRPNVASGCKRYPLQVRNLGDVYNRFTVTVTDRPGVVAASTRIGDGRDRSISIHNHTAETIFNLYWSNTAEGSWGTDQLGSNIMRARTNRSVNVSDGTGACRFDFKIKTASGREYTKSNVDVCSVSSVEFGTEISH